MFDFTLPPPPPPPQRAAHNAELNGPPSAGRSAASFLCSCAAVPGGVSIPATGCGPGVKNAPGAPSACRDTDSPGLVRGAGIEPRHSQSMADRTIRHMLANPVLERAAPPQSRNDERRCDRRGAAGRGRRATRTRTSETPMQPYYHRSTDGSASSPARPAAVGDVVGAGGARRGSAAPSDDCARSAAARTSSTTGCCPGSKGEEGC